MNPLITLVKREFWETRGFTWVPAVMAALLLLATLMGVTSALYKSSDIVEHIKHAEINIEIENHDLSNYIGKNIFDMASDEQKRKIVQGAFAGMGAVFYLPLMIVILFYFLDTLYSERQNRSIYFWKSMPISDTETVLSKLLTGAIVAPIATFCVIALVQLIVMLIFTPAVWILDGSAWDVLWKPANPPVFWLSLLLGIMMQAIWWSPVYAWCLLVSSWTTRSPIVSATLPILALGFMEAILGKIFTGNGSYTIFSTVGHRLSGGLIHWSGEYHDDTLIQLISTDKLSDFFTSASVWAGLVFAAIFIAAAIYFRRNQNEC